MSSYIAAPSYNNFSPNMVPRTGFLGSIKARITRKNSSSSHSTISRSSTSTSSGSKSNTSLRPLVPAVAPVAINRNTLSPAAARSNDPPPAYSPRASTPASISGVSSARSSISLDDRYSFLRAFDTVFLIDDSGSMVGRSWRETKEALVAITPICTSYDADGIDIHFLNTKDNQFFHNVKTPSTVQEIFTSVRPRGGTPTGTRLRQILKPYLDRYYANPEGTKPLNIIVITDGEPSDDVESTIIWAAKRLDKKDAPAWQVGIQFFQVGNEPGAREHLKQLDDDLAEMAGDDDLRDIVDTVPWTSANGGTLNADGILKVTLGAVTRRLDKSRVQIHT